ncbi:MAG: ribonuclease P protein component 3 [Methanosarcinaceae archaeon]|nr:ribonuclease P protein component 3 [Methanosarcinaceae archaeon]
MGKPQFYDLNVHSRPDNESTIEELTALAKHFGYSGLAITNHSNTAVDPVATGTEDFEILRGIEIVATSPSKLHGLIGKYRKNVDVLIVHGGNENINRAAVENPNVDVLAHPQMGRQSGLNHILAKSASENNVAIEFNLDAIIKGRGGRRVQTLSNFRTNLNIARKYDVPMLLTSNASSYFDMRAPREMIAIAGMFGMSKNEAVSALSLTAKGIIQKKRSKPGFIREGVEVIGEDVLEGTGDPL